MTIWHQNSIVSDPILSFSSHVSLFPWLQWLKIWPTLCKPLKMLWKALLPSIFSLLLAFTLQIGPFLLVLLPNLFGVRSQSLFFLTGSFPSLNSASKLVLEQHLFLERWHVHSDTKMLHMLLTWYLLAQCAVSLWFYHYHSRSPALTQYWCNG